MSRGVVTVPTEGSRTDVIETMKRHGIGALPVAEAGGHIVGVVSEGDLLTRQGSAALDLMTPIGHTVRPDFAVSVTHYSRYSRVPVRPETR